MANFQPQKMNFAEINGGNKYTDADGLQSKTINDVVQSTMYSQMLATNQPNIDEIDGEGEPSITIEEVGGSPRLKFTNFGNRQKVAILSKKVENLESRLNDEDFSVVEANAYEQQVPTNALPFAEVTKVGGMTHKVFGENLLNSFSLSDFVDGKDDGLTFTNNGDGSFTVNGTSTMPSFLKLNTVSLEIGKSYVLSGSTVAPSLGANQPAFGLTDGEMIDGGYGNSFVAKSSTADIYFFVYESDITFNNVVIRPNLKTVELKNAKVTEIKSFGANLIPFPYVNASGTIGGITYTVNEDGTVGVSGKSNGNPYFKIYGGFPAEKKPIPEWLEVGKTYTASSGNSNVYLMVYVYKEDGSQQLLTGTFTMPDGYSYCGIYLWVSSAVTASGVCKPMLNIGSTALPYAQQKEYPPLPIPQAVQNLDGYGRGVSEEYCNYIEWSPTTGAKKFVVKTKMQIFTGEEYWSFGGTGNERRANYTCSTAGDVAVCNRFPFGHAIEKVGTFDNVNNAYLRFNVANLNINTADEWKALLAQWNAEGNPLTVVYGVAETQETDISHILSDDNFIEVEAGGVVIPENEDKLAAPLQVVYQVK